MIEVSLPLEAINTASAREKSIRHGHPSTLHLWWARRPLAAARAVIFAQMVDDPSSNPELFPTEAEQETERQRLFKIIEELVLWENTTNEEVLERAREEIRTCWQRTCADNADHPQADELFNPEKLPAFHDPFAGGGALPLEAQRLGLEAYASDLNPVAVLINKAMIEIPPKFANMPPIHPGQETDRDKGFWSGAQGLAEDVRYYGKWMRDEAERRIGHLYPKVKVTKAMVKERPDLKQYEGKELTVIAWLWARTVKSPNPAFAHVDVPLVSTFMLSTKSGKEAYVEPVIGKDNYHFKVKMGEPKDVTEAKKGTKLARGANFRCIISNMPIQDQYIKCESMEGRMGERLMAIVAEGERGRVYINPTKEHELIATLKEPEWKPEQSMNRDTRDLVSGRGYGFFTWADLFTTRQLVAITTFCDLVLEVNSIIKQDALKKGLKDDNSGLVDGGLGAKAYADAISIYLALAIDRMTNTICKFARWTPERQQTVTVFARQAIPMTWDYPDVNPFANAAGDYSISVNGVIKGIPSITNPMGHALQIDASAQNISLNKVVSTDPPYYDNIGYADLSDFFYVWLRKTLKSILPNLFTTLVVPKVEELVALTYRHGNKEKAEVFFLNGMSKVMNRIYEQSHQTFPVTIYYAFKQSEIEENGLASTGWETFLDAVICAGFAITGTWPMRTELSNRMIGSGTNALASSIVLVCKKREKEASITTRRDYLSILKEELPQALAHLQRGNIAPVDLAQASIGPGMAVFTRFQKVLEPNGNPMSVRTALELINQVLDQSLTEQESEYDADTRWALAWFEQYGHEQGPYGEAEMLSTAKGVSVKGLVDSGILEAKSGKVRLLKRDEYKEDWDPLSDNRIPVWEITQYLIRKHQEDGVQGAAEIYNKTGALAGVARDLAYRLYSICERKKWAQDALAYNALVIDWNTIVDTARTSALQHTEYQQESMI